MSNTLIEMQARHQIQERLTRASGAAHPRLGPSDARGQPPPPDGTAAAQGRRPGR